MDDIRAEYEDRLKETHNIELELKEAVQKLKSQTLNEKEKKMRLENEMVGMSLTVFLSLLL